MFGYVTVNQSDLTEDEMNRYREVYCGVCRALHERSGNVSRMMLNHDLVFAAMLLMSLYEPEEEHGQVRCIAHPIKQRAYTSNAYVDYAADMTVLMAYYKLLDNWEDDRSHVSLATSKLLQSAYERVRELYPRQCDATESGLAKISQIEKAGANEEVRRENPDEASMAFGRILAEVFVFEEDAWSEQLRTFGFELGRFVYMMDAAIDVAKDEESGSYNPFVGCELEDGEIRMLLASYMARATDVFERLPLVQDAHILRSVLYSGVWGRLNAEEKKRQENEMCENEEELSRG